LQLFFGKKGEEIEGWKADWSKRNHHLSEAIRTLLDDLSIGAIAE
jgi:hypothetical protein